MKSNKLWIFLNSHLTLVTFSIFNLALPHWTELSHFTITIISQHSLFVHDDQMVLSKYCRNSKFCRYTFTQFWANLLGFLFVILDFCSKDAHMYSIHLCVFIFAPDKFSMKSQKWMQRKYFHFLVGGQSWKPQSRVRTKCLDGFYIYELCRFRICLMPNLKPWAFWEIQNGRQLYKMDPWHQF